MRHLEDIYQWRIIWKIFWCLFPVALFALILNLVIGAKHRTIPPPEDAAFLNGGMDTMRIFDAALPG